MNNIIPFVIQSHNTQKPTNLIERYITSSTAVNQLKVIQHSFNTASHLEFYTDGSVINIGQESMSMSLAFVQTNSRYPQTKYNAILERFPSSTRAESFAILAALLTAPLGCYVDIFTDSSAVIHLSSKTDISVRNTFKENNNVLWATIRELMDINNLFVNFYKVKAHSKNKFNDLADELASSAHFDNTHLIDLENCGQQHLSYVPKWRNLTVDQHLRHFIKQISKTKGFEKWFNLFRNTKYRSSWIDWDATFYILNDNGNKSTTSFTNSTIKAKKIKFLIEELPTVEHVKKRRPDLYNNWACPRCNIFDETFQHIWLCMENSRDANLIHIMDNFKQNLLDILQLYDPSLSQHYLDCQHINDCQHLWDTFDSLQHLTFIDIIKGFVPGFLSDRLFGLYKNRSLVLDILSHIYHDLFISIYTKIWLPRCEAMITKEKQHNISTKEKKKRCSSRSNCNHSSNRSNFHTDLVDTEFGLELEIRIGCSWLCFTMLFNCYNLSCCCCRC